MDIPYVALLRGINVGGNSIIKMAELKPCLEQAGFDDVRTYIQSGNVLFVAKEQDTRKLAEQISAAIKKQFSVTAETVVISKDRWQQIVAKAPAWWGKDADWKHNIIVLIEPFNVKDVVAAIGELKPNIERIAPGDGVIYQSLSWDSFGKTTSGKLASKPVYKQITVRNYNTAKKLAELL